MSAETTHDIITFRPACDIYENAEELLLVVDLPGVSQDSIEVSIEADVLTLVGQRKARQTEGAKVLAGQTDAIEFRRTFTVGSRIDQDKIKAEYKDGVLEVHLPRHEKTRPRRINVAA